MCKPTPFAAAALLALVAAPAAQAQGGPDFSRMDLSRFNDCLNARMGGQPTPCPQQPLQPGPVDPRMLAAYRAGLCGPGLTWPQFAYKYGATGGCTPEGYARYNAFSRQIAAQAARRAQTDPTSQGRP